MNKFLLNNLKKVNLLIRHCNLSCPMCSMNANAKDVPQILRDYPGASQGPEMTLEEYQSFFSQLKDLQLRVSIGGGEPFVFKEMDKLVGYLIKECHFYVGITSNGTVLDPTRLENFAQVAQGITLSIDGLEETHDQIRGKGNFQKTVQTIQSLKKYQRSNIFKGDINTLFVIHQSNYREMRQVAQFVADDLKMSSHTMSFLIFNNDQTLREHNQWCESNQLDSSYQIKARRGHFDAHDLKEKMDYDLIWSSKTEIERQYSQIHFEPNFQSKDHMIEYFETNHHMPDYFDRKCRPISHEMTLLSNGDILFFPGCFEICCGNIRNQSLEEIMNNEMITQLRKTLDHSMSPLCSHCCANRVQKNYL